MYKLNHNAILFYFIFINYVVFLYIESIVLHLFQTVLCISIFCVRNKDYNKDHNKDYNNIIYVMYIFTLYQCCLRVVYSLYSVCRSNYFIY